MVQLKCCKLHPDAQLPSFGSAGAACFDLCYVGDSDLVVRAGYVSVIPTGLAVEVPHGYEMQVRARSGLAKNNGFMLVNGVGTIDSDYRGEVCILGTVLKGIGVDGHIDNEDGTTTPTTTFKQTGPLVIKPGMRIAQACLAPVLETYIVEASELSDTARGTGGFGSTGEYATGTATVAASSCGKRATFMG